MLTHLKAFQCLICKSNNFAESQICWTCLNCEHAYRVEQSIPILIRDWTFHEQELEHARQINPSWYVQEQLPENISPYRHQLLKRRLYVEATIQDYLRKQQKPQAVTLLDLGCGDGNHLVYLQKYAEAAFGSDYNLVRLVRAKARQPDTHLFLADILDYPVADNYFEIIFFNHVIEHIADDLSALRTIYRILRPNGLLILGTPNEGAWWWQLAYRLQPQTLQRTDHVNFYTVDTLAQKLTQAGFKTIDAKLMGWGVPHWSFDACLRQSKWIDDLFENVGKMILPRQASSIYMIATKTNHHSA